MALCIAVDAHWIGERETLRTDEEVTGWGLDVSFFQGDYSIKTGPALINT